MALAIPLDQMTANEKLQLLEELWADLAKQPEEIPSPDWHGEILRQREQRIASGSACFYDIADAKQAVRDHLK